MFNIFEIFNKVKIDTNKYNEVDTSNNENLKEIMKERLKSSQRIKKKKQKTNIIITVASSLLVVIVGVGIANPSLADNIIKNINEFKTMLDKVKESVDEDSTVPYDKDLYLEREEEKQEHKDNKLIATPVNVSSKSDELEITINKAMYDKKKIYLDMILKTDKPFKQSEIMDAISESPYGDGQLNMYINISEIFINNIKQDSYAYSTGIVEYVDEHTISLSYLIDLDIDNDIEDANFKLTFGIRQYKNQELRENIKGQWSFDFNIKAIDDARNNIQINEKSGEYTLKGVKLTDTYVEVEVELPFEPGLGNPHNNFIVVKDDKGQELRMSNGVDSKIAKYIYELETVGQDLKYIDIIVIESYMDIDNPEKFLSSFRVDKLIFKVDNY
ncbi:MAG: DUF4179 domain-containing protein [Romboutsia sp.]|uniref:DUF4179 domain-containing protein n=1 Tax=Romboutsia sp. TaxID=1965302 RepID=UPI003F346DC5